jgi:polyisoprenoid-binding protein YceI
MKVYSASGIAGAVLVLASIAGMTRATTHGDARAARPTVERMATGRIRLALAPEGNEARYRVREQLAGIDFPSDAVGATTAVTGALVIETDGSIVRDQSRFVVDLRTLTTDNSRRDNYVRRNTLQTDTFPTAEFVPAAFTGLPSPLPTSGELSFHVTGDLTIHGVTTPVTWDVTARATENGYTGLATVALRFADFGMRVPRVRSVLSVEDDIRLEYEFNLVPETLSGSAGR